MINRSTVQSVTTITLVMANLCLCVIYLSAWTGSQAQNNNKKRVTRPLAKEPVEITIEHRGQLVRENEEFEGDADWLKNLKFKIKNRSDKVITYLVLDLTFPQTATAANSSTGLHQIRLGISPDLKSGGSQFRLAPGDSKEISLDTEYPDMKKLVESRIRVENISDLVVRLETAVFDDETKWFAGVLYRRNPNSSDPSKWIPIQ